MSHSEQPEQFICLSCMVYLTFVVEELVNIK